VSDIVLVTGAAGFAGSHLVEHLSRSQNGVARTRHTVDLLDRDRVRAAIGELRPTQVCHFAGMTHTAVS
jgi:nucleoside-diphosphate-sugar epimerase